MLHYYLFWNVLFILTLIGFDFTASKPNTAGSILSPETSKEKLSSTTNVALSSEGGPLTPGTAGLTLLQGNYSIPVMLKDTGKNKVVARKGVVYSETVSKSQENSSSSSTENTTNKVSTSGDKPTVLNEPLKTANEIKPIRTNNTSVNKTIAKEQVETVKIHKPLILAADKLENMTVKTTIIYNQLQSPKNSYLTNPNGPGMVMPIVITILLVPMFAVLGYMALRRGQEAWKNRHYKRMDFLLDGMYND